MYDTGVVVLNYKNYELTKKCVDKMLFYKSEVRIVVVDNASGNGSYEFLAKEYEGVDNVVVIENHSNAGYARGNNFGIRFLLENYEDTEFVCIMNPDVEIGYAEIFSNLSEHLRKHDDVAAITGLMISNKTLKLRWCYWNIPKKREIAFGHCAIRRRKPGELTCESDGIARVEVLPGSFFMIKRSVFERLGGLDEGTFLYNEENLFGIQVKMLGMHNALSIRDFYFHNHPKGSRPSLKAKLSHSKHGVQSRRYLCRKYYGKLDRILLEAVIAANYIIIILLHIGGSIKRAIKK